MRLKYVRRTLIAASFSAAFVMVLMGLYHHDIDVESYRHLFHCPTCKYQTTYGNHTIIKYNDNGDCKQQILVLGLHNSGTSMVARLMTLLGIWVGRPDQLALGKNNKLKWWERVDVMRINDGLTSNHTNPSHPTWIGFGFDHHLVLDEERARFRRDAGSVVADLNRFCPWLVKDPRMCFMATMWMELMTAPVCVIVYRHPARLALRLGSHWYKGDYAKLGPTAWLTVWESMMTAALRSCRSKPTVLVQSALAKPETIDLFYDLLIDDLKAAGIKSITRPSPAVLAEHYLQHYRPTHTVRTDREGGEDVDEASRKCAYAEVSPADFINRTRHGVAGMLDLMQAWPDDCAIEAPDSARALVLAFEKVLAQRYAQRFSRHAHPSGGASGAAHGGGGHVPPQLLAMTVLRNQEDLLYDMTVDQQTGR